MREDRLSSPLLLTQFQDIIGAYERPLFDLVSYIFHTILRVVFLSLFDE